MGIRYNGRKKKNNSEKVYEEFIEARGVKSLTHYTTPTIPQLTAQQRRSLTIIRHVWKSGDKYWKLANEHYGDSELWWLIAWYNQRPTETHIKLGDTVYIPLPLEKILRYYRG
tara:strand:+ start:172 stop:510 length:339 start_codon:yes stop_codon:yes gene_type:complete